MADIEKNRPGVQANLLHVMELLRKQRLAAELAQRQELPRRESADVAEKHGFSELRQKLDQLHPADVAYLLESLPLDERLIVWELVRAERDGEILLEVSDAVRESLIAHMENTELVKAAEQLDTDEIADLAP